MLLLELPSAWLSSLVRELQGEALLRFFQTCTTSRDLVLAFRAVQLALGLPAQEQHAAVAQRCLRLVCERATSVALLLRGWEAWKHVAIDLHAIAAWLFNYVDENKPIHKLTLLQDFPSDSLIPSWLAHLCARTPSLHTIQLSTCLRERPPGTTTAMPMCPGIKHLKIDYIDFSVQTPEQWQNQLQSLPGLQILDMFGHDWRLPIFLSECCLAIGHQLTHLRLAGSMTHHATIPAQFAASCTRLTKLEFMKDMNDTDMDVLLSIATLRHVACTSFNLQRSHTACQCPWTHLDLTTLDLASVSRLSLPVLQTLNLQRSYLQLSPDSAITAAAVTTLSRCTVHWCPQTDLDVSGVKWSQVPAECIIAGLPLIATHSHSKQLVWRVQQVTVELLAAMQQHLAGINVHQWCFHFGIFAPGAGSQLLPSLPPTTKMVVLSSGGINPAALTLSQLVAICVHAHRPITVCLHCHNMYSTWPHNWQQLVEIAMAEAGHQHVTIQKW